MAGYTRIDGLAGAMAGRYFQHQSLAVLEVPKAVSAVHAGPREDDPQIRTRSDIGRGVITKNRP